MGYETNRFVDKPSKQLLCPICTEVLEEPVMCSNEHMFCKLCVNKWLENRQQCPVDRAPCTSDGLLPVARAISQMIHDLKLSCRFKASGCPEVFAVELESRHAAECEFNDDNGQHKMDEALTEFLSVTNELQKDSKKMEDNIDGLGNKYFDLLQLYSKTEEEFASLKLLVSMKVDELNEKLSKEFKEIATSNNAKFKSIHKLETAFEDLNNKIDVLSKLTLEVKVIHGDKKEESPQLADSSPSTAATGSQSFAAIVRKGTTLADKEEAIGDDPERPS